MIYIMMIAVFVLGYITIAFEHNIHVDKAASAILTAVILWTLLVLGFDSLAAHLPAAVEMGNHVNVASHASGFLNTELRHHLAEIAEILFFLMGAMVIVELIDAHGGFDVVTRYINTENVTTLVWIVGGFTFFLSSLLDNLTTTIVMVSLLRKLISNTTLRWWFAGIVIICANAGGAWSPVGDVTTTMLWIGNQVTASKLIMNLFIPSLVASLVPMALVSYKFRGRKLGGAIDNDSLIPGQPIMAESFEVSQPVCQDTEAEVTHPAVNVSPQLRKMIFILGLGSLAFVPIFKTITHLPPYMGVLLGLAVLWIFTELTHRHGDDKTRQQLTVIGVLTRVDMPSILFFLGILLSVSALATSGHLADMGRWLDQHFGSLYTIDIVIGLLSSLIDNVPLVAGAMKMYPLLTQADVAGLSGEALAHQSKFLQDGQFWHFLAYCAGTGGSCLIIGSAAGVAAMGMEKIPFMWYLKRISGLALLGYLAGALTYIVMHVL